ncbi:MAG: hypothetical protein II776_05510, partial [Clostridia bacterium]|nr:hypothetical protein [Clostridia bacterium]
DGEITGHETEVDREMRVVRFEREQQPPVVIANWQCHPHRTGGSNKFDISSDIIGVMRDKAEKDLGVKFLYLQGGAGNINPVSRISGEARFSDYRDIGKELAETLRRGLDDMREVKTGALRAASVTFDAQVRHENEELLAVCKEVYDIYARNRKTEAEALAKANGMTGAIEARAIWRNAQKAATEPVTVNCYAIGDVAFTAAPFEMFCQTEKQLREDSPFAFTVTCGYSNTSHGYMPAAESFPNKGYEVFQCHYVQGTAEIISEHQLRMLNDLHGN